MRVRRTEQVIIDADDVSQLSPGQRAKTIMLFLLIPVVACIVGVFVLSTMFHVSDTIKEREHAPAAIELETINRSETASELLLALSDRVRAFDDEARKYFGRRHEWTENGDRITPQYIDDYVQAKGDLKYLKEYFEMSKSRVDLESQIRDLEAKVDAAVSSIPDDATPDRKMKAERLVRNDIVEASEALEREFAALEAFGTEYKEFLEEKENAR